jgi:hypothetical protein
MIIYDKENNGFKQLVDFINEKWESGNIQDLVFRLCYNGETILAKYDTMYESDNGLDLDCVEYEEFNAIVFENQKTHKLFEVTYKTLPHEIFCGDVKVI